MQAHVLLAEAEATHKAEEANRRGSTDIQSLLDQREERNALVRFICYIFSLLLKPGRKKAFHHLEVNTAGNNTWCSIRHVSSCRDKLQMYSEKVFCSFCKDTIAEQKMIVAQLPRKIWKVSLPLDRLSEMCKLIIIQVNKNSCMS